MKQMRFLLILFCFWRLGLFALSAVAPSILPYRPSFSFHESFFTERNLPHSLSAWANFDGVFYTLLAEQGYGTIGSLQAFFPMLPILLMRPLALVFAHQAATIIIGLLITNLAAFGSLVLWYFFMRREYNERVALHAVAVLLLFPTSFFLGALYTESLFLFFVIGSLFAARRRQWAIAGLLAACASSTRIVGMALIPALAIELWQQWQTQGGGRWRDMLWILCGSLGILGYMTYLGIRFGDPLLFSHVQSSFGAGRSSTFILYPQVVVRSLRILLTARPFDLKYVTYIQDVLAGVIPLLVITPHYKKIPVSVLIFGIGAMFIPPLTGTFLSMPRYIIACLPLLMVISIVAAHHKRLGMLWYVLSTAMLMINTVLFIQGYWVA